MARAEESYADAVTVTTTEYLTAVRECVAVLPATVLRYETDRFDEHVQRLSERESACDERLRELRRLCGRAKPNFTDVYLRTDEVMELYAMVDRVPNAAERFVRELDATRPTLDAATADDLAEMAALTARVTGVLADAIEAYASGLVSTAQPADPRDEIDLIADLESRADARKHDVVARAFAGGTDAEALLVRDVAESLDATLDAAEDAADHLLFMHGASR